MTTETFWTRFERLRASLDIHDDASFDRAYGVPANSQKNWRTRGTQPDQHTLRELSDIFGVTMDYLYDGTTRTGADQAAARALARALAEGPPPLPRRRRRRNNAPPTSS